MKDLSGDITDVEILLTEFECTLIVFGYSLKKSDEIFLRKLCYITEEGRLLSNPSI